MADLSTVYSGDLNRINVEFTAQPRDPSEPPKRIGILWINTVTRALYVSTGDQSQTDWTRTF